MTNLENLIETLDVKYYIDMSFYEKKELEDYLYKSNNKPLRTIINNFKHRKENRLNIDFLYGPIYFKIFKKGDIQIALIGENHIEYTEYTEMKYTKERTIMDIYDYLLHLFKYSYLPLDFFLEGIYNIHPLNIREKRILKLRYILSPCINKKFECPYHTTRFHYGDIRQLKDERSLLEITSIDDLPKLKYVEQYCKAYYMLMKQIDKCDNEIIKKEAIYFIENEYDAFFTKPLRIFDPKVARIFGKSNMIAKDAYYAIVKENIDIENIDEDTNSLFKFIFKKIDDMSAIFIDYYILCRFFRKFKKDDRYIFIKPRNIIFYGGAYHTIHMGIVLKKAGFKEYDLRPFPIDDKNYFVQINNIDIFGLNNFSPKNDFEHILSDSKKSHANKRLKLLYDKLDNEGIPFDEFIDFYYTIYSKWEIELHEQLPDDNLITILNGFIQNIKDNVFDKPSRIEDTLKQVSAKLENMEAVKERRQEGLLTDFEKRIKLIYDTYISNSLYEVPSYDEFINLYTQFYSNKELDNHAKLSDEELIPILKHLLLMLEYF